MSRTYDVNIHSFAYFGRGSHEDLAGLQSVVLVTRTSVWIDADYHMAATLVPAGLATLVGDGSPDAHDEDGSCVLSVRRELVREWYGDTEAWDVQRCIDADDQLLRYAR